MCLGNISDDLMRLISVNHLKKKIEVCVMVLRCHTERVEMRSPSCQTLSNALELSKTTNPSFTLLVTSSTDMLGDDTTQDRSLSEEREER